MNRNNIKKYLAPGLLLALVIIAFVWAAKQQSELLNIDMEATDQSAYMEYARNMAQTNLHFVGDRNRMPLYPGLMSFFYKQGMSDQDFFEVGKNIGIAIGLIVSAVTFFLFNRVSNTVDALVGTLVTMFTVVVYKSPYFQSEMLFYGLNLILFYLLLSLIRDPQIKTAAFAGVVGGIAHLTKASVLPAILLAVVLIIIRGVIYWRQQDVDTQLKSYSRKRYMLNHVGYACALLGLFLLVIFPYIQTSKERFGHYFYNVNSTFYMWYDSWEEVKEGTRAHGDRVGWPDMPEEQIPSMQKYIREHSLYEMGRRIMKGVILLGGKIFQSYGYAEFVLAYTIALALLFIQNRKQVFHLLRQTNPCVLLFVFGYFLGYVILYAWYTPIATGLRFVLTLFLPAMLLIVWLLAYAQEHNLAMNVLGRRVTALEVSPAILLFLAVYMFTVFTSNLTTLYAGS